MPFARASLSELITRVKGDLRGRLEINNQLLRRAMADVLGTVWAGAVHTVYGFVDWASRQLFAGTADSDVMLRRAALYGIVPVAATFATGNVTITGTNGSMVLAGEILRLDAATTYEVTTGGTISAGTATLVVTAVLAGAAGNLPETTELTFESPVAGVNSTATVATGGLTGGTDAQGPDVVLERYLLRLRQPPEGGADQDYVAWTLAASGASATRAWTYPNENGLGTVVVRFVNDNGTPTIFPTGGQVTAAQTALDAERPITAVVTAAAPTNLSVAFTIALTPSNADTQAAVTAQLTDLMARVAEPGDGAGRGTVLLSAIRTAIGISAGVTDYTLTVPSADVVPAVGQLATVGTITWT